jgi:hypothetical protein
VNFRPTNRSYTARSHSAPFRIAAMLLATAVLVTSATPAVASTETLRRSVSNISQAPLDFLFSPFVGIYSVITRMREQDDPTAVRVAFFVPGIVWNTGVNLGGATIRLITGGIELIPGIFLVPFEADLDVLYAPVTNAAAMYEMETPCCIDVKFGIDYTAAVN